MRTAIFLTFAALALPATADEGMWLFNQFPKHAVRNKHAFEVTDAFLDQMRLSSVRFPDGSGSFVSPNGLVMTNHHIASECVQHLSSKEHDYMANGFYASTEADERPCPNTELNVLVRIEDVTAKVKDGVKPAMPDAEANRIRKANMARIEKDCSAAAGHRCETVTLYSGAQFHLYEYRKYTDVRLVFAPEADVAAFGGDPDNFTYPRYCLDVAFVRAYENGKPALTRDYLQWSRGGVKDRELSFVAGNPGATGRLATVAEMEFDRDAYYPLVQSRMASLVHSLEAYGAKSAENRRIARDNLFSQQNSYKAYTGFLGGLRDAKLMERKREGERAFREKIGQSPRLKQEYGSVFDEVAKAFAEFRGFYKPYLLLESRGTRGSDLMEIARHVLRYAEERAKPNEQRLKDYIDSSLPRVEQTMYSPAPIYDTMEAAVIADYFRFLERELGANDATLKALLAGRTPDKAAGSYVSASKLKDVAVRRQLASSAEAVRASDDGLIRLVRILDGPARQARRLYEDKVEAVTNGSAAKIALARFAIFGANEYPDATFTLRLAYGPVEGYRTAAGQSVPYATDFAGLYRRATGKDPYRLPARWIKSKSALDLKTPFNFVTTADTHGGNSGSPTVDTKGEIIGILFDGNLEGLPNRFVYDDKMARSVHVASQGIIEALRKVYHADRLLKELLP